VSRKWIASTVRRRAPTPCQCSSTRSRPKHTGHQWISMAGCQHPDF
jgi:hypothetical protein